MGTHEQQTARAHTTHRKASTHNHMHMHHIVDNNHTQWHPWTNKTSKHNGIHAQTKPASAHTTEACFLIFRKQQAEDPASSRFQGLFILNLDLASSLSTDETRKLAH
jgi:hypothetical protein